MNWVQPGLLIHQVLISNLGTGKFFKEQSISEKQNIYEEIDEAIKKLQRRKINIYLTKFIVYNQNYGN